MTDVFKALKDNKVFMAENIGVQDPVSKLSGAQKTAKELFAGEIALSGAKLTPRETVDLLQAARELAASAPGTSRTLKVARADVSMTRLADGVLSLKIGGKPLRAAAFDAQGLVRMMEDEIVSKPGDFDKAVVKSALPPLADVESGRVPLGRARELYAKAAAAKTGTLPVVFSACTTAQLRDIAVRAVDGQFTAADLPSKPPATYNSGAMIEMHAAMAKTSAAEIDAKVKIAALAPKSIDARRTVAPYAATVKNIVADLFLNKDTWAFDASATGQAQPGERVRKLLLEHEPELAFILKGLGKEGEDLLANLPANVRDAVKGVFEDIKTLNLRRLVDPGDLPPGARDALAAIDAKIDAAALFSKAFPEGGGEMKRLTDVLKRGSSLDLMSRVQAFIAIVQSKDVPVPAPLQNFVQSYVRLCDIVEDIDRTVADLQVAANSIYCDVPKLASAPGEPKTFTLLKAVASAYVGSAGSQCSPAAMRSAGADFAKWAASDEGKAEIRSIARDPARIKNELAPLVDTLKGIGLYTHFDHSADPGNVGVPDTVKKLVEMIQEFDDVEKEGKIQNGQIVSDSTRTTSIHGPIKESDLFNLIERDLLDMGEGLASDYMDKLGTQTRGGEPVFMNLAAKVEKSVTDVCSDVISDNSNSLIAPAFGEYGTGALKFQGRLEKAAEEGEAKALRMKNVGPALEEKNLELPPGERLTGQEMATLSRATSTFLVPSPRPDDDPKWATVPAKRTAMLDAIAYNLARAARAMKLPEGQPLTNAAVRHAAHNMGLLDKQLAESILALGENDYNTLLLEAQNAAGGLSHALSALRGSRELLQTVQTQAPVVVEDDDE